jgi:uncharacterized protein YjbI with pentapeptide repeats
MKLRTSAKGGIQPPKLVIEQDLTELPADALSDHEELSRIGLANCDLAGTEARGMLIDQARFSRVDLSRSKLPTLELLDARLESCDLAGADWEKGRFTRVELLDCRLTGTRFFDATADDLIMRDCNCELAIFWSARFRRVRFDRCLFRRASFEGADLTGVIFRGCDLTGADLRNAKLQGTDLRGSTITGLQVHVRDLEGAIVDPGQALDLAPLLGVHVLSEPEE